MRNLGPSLIFYYFVVVSGVEDCIGVNLISVKCKGQ